MNQKSKFINKVDQADRHALHVVSEQVMQLAQTAGFNLDGDFYKQEVDLILKANAHNPAFSMLDHIEQHCKMRGFDTPLGQRAEHDAAHIVMALAFHQSLAANLLKPEDQIDFQTGSYIEVFANDMEQNLSPQGVLARWRENNPDAFNVSPYSPHIADITRSVENEENYIKSLCWIIGAHTGHRAQNIRHIYGNIDARATLEQQVNDLGYTTNFKKEADFKEIEWSITTPDNEVYACKAGKAPQLPQGHNGVETFDPLKFPSREEVDKIYALTSPVIAFIRDQRQGRTMDETLADIPVQKVVAMIDSTISTLKPTAPAISPVNKAPKIK